jgi:hypothetical protein
MARKKAAPLPRGTITKANRAKLDRARATAPAMPTGQLASITYDYERVTPERATEWLEGKVANRNIVDDHVHRLARDMVGGAWQRNGETIKFTADGRLIDGQHRLWAVVTAGVAIWFDVARGVSEAAMLTVDTNRRRTFANHLQIATPGSGVSTAIVSAAVRIWHWYDKMVALDAPTLGFRGNEGSHAELAFTLSQHPSVLDAAVMAKRSKGTVVRQQGKLAFILSGAIDANRDRAAEWFNDVNTGADLSTDSPAYRLRERLLSTQARGVKLDNIEYIALLMKSWVLYYHHRPCGVLRWLPTEGFPRFPGR